jgi:hypothetical protein
MDESPWTNLVKFAWGNVWRQEQESPKLSHVVMLQYRRSNMPVLWFSCNQNGRISITAANTKPILYCDSS